MSKSGLSTLGALREAVARGDMPRRTVREEVRDNLIRKLRTGETLFPGIIGYDDSVVPQLVNALLSQHNFILLGLRGQAKTRLLRALTTLLDEAIPVVPGCEINDDPLEPLCGACRARVAADGDRLPIAWLGARLPLRREAGNAGRDHCRYGRGHRPDQGGTIRAAAFERAHDALRAAAQGQSWDFRDQ
jgi:hypothetical protein